MVGNTNYNLGFGRFWNVNSGHFRPFFGEPWPLVFRIFRRILSLWTKFYRCGGWDTVAVGLWVPEQSPEQSPVCHGRVDDDCTEFGSPGSVGISCHCSSYAGPRGGGPGASQAPASSSSSVAQPPSARRRHRPTDTIDTTSTDGTGASGSQPAKKNTRGPCRQLKTAKVTRVTNSRISIGYDERHRAAPTAELHSSLAHDIGHVVRTHCPMQWKSWRVMPDEIKAEVRGQLSTNYNLEDLDEESLTYVNRLFAERYKQWKSDLHHHFQAYDDPQVALQEGCPKELEGREDSWEWLCAHFQAPEFANKAQVNKGNRKKKTLLHHSGSRPFSYRMDARRREGSKFPEIDVFGDVYVRPGNELAESLHTTMVERSQLVLQESASQLPPETPIESVAPPQDAGFQILTETLDQTLGRRPGTYCRGMGNARRREPRPRSSVQSSRQVTALTAHMVTLENKLSAILHSLAQSGIPVPHFDEPTPSPSLPSIPPDHCPG
ncbi:Ankyrin repeat family protein [Prunus dulcis]|uniref:Ankyrin repeat family protein n=1 Tax=Prunus dulcis TaxID=3755 RepID=A0A4Y1R6U0_PRUDU|nr:Ankyrin repeat family protein [Prunus dulcis]